MSYSIYWIDPFGDRTAPAEPLTLSYGQVLTCPGPITTVLAMDPEPAYTIWSVISVRYPMRLLQRDDGLGGVQGHPRLSQAAASFASSVGLRIEGGNSYR